MVSIADCVTFIRFIVTMDYVVSDNLCDIFYRVLEGFDVSVGINDVVV